MRCSSPVVTSGDQEQNEVIFSDEVYPQIRCTLGQWTHNFRQDVTPLPQLKLVVQSPAKPGQFDNPLPQLNPAVQSSTTPGQSDPPQSNLMLQSPTTPCQFDMWDTTPGQFDMWKNADVPRSDVPPPNWT